MWSMMRLEERSSPMDLIIDEINVDLLNRLE